MTFAGFKKSEHIVRIHPKPIFNKLWEVSLRVLKRIDPNGFRFVPETHGAGKIPFVISSLKISRSKILVEGSCSFLIE